MQEYGISLRDGQLVVSCPDCHGGFCVAGDDPLPAQIQRFTDGHTCRLIPAPRTPLRLVRSVPTTR
jgi:hypothetical protein